MGKCIIPQSVGGGNTVGSITLKDKTGDNNYVPCDGRILKVKDYPELRNILPPSLEFQSRSLPTRFSNVITTIDGLNLLVLDDDGIHISNDGINSQTYPNPFLSLGGINGYSLAKSGDTYVACAFTASDIFISTSSTGLDWTPIKYIISPQYEIYGDNYSVNLYYLNNTWIITVILKRDFIDLYSSSDLNSWNKEHSFNNSTKLYTNLLYVNNSYIFCTNNGGIFNSIDLKIWTQTFLPFTTINKLWVLPSQPNRLYRYSNTNQYNEIQYKDKDQPWVLLKTFNNTYNIPIIGDEIFMIMFSKTYSSGLYLGYSYGNQLFDLPAENRNISLMHDTKISPILFKNVWSYIYNYSYQLVQVPYFNQNKAWLRIK